MVHSSTLRSYPWHSQKIGSYGSLVASLSTANLMKCIVLLDGHLGRIDEVHHTIYNSMSQYFNSGARGPCHPVFSRGRRGIEMKGLRSVLRVIL